MRLSLTQLRKGLSPTRRSEETKKRKTGGQKVRGVAIEPSCEETPSEASPPPPQPKLKRTINVLNHESASSSSPLPANGEEESFTRYKKKIAPKLKALEEATLPEDTEKEKIIKTVEQVECGDCGKKVKDKTLKYSHKNTCTRNGAKEENGEDVRERGGGDRPLVKRRLERQASKNQRMVRLTTQIA